MIYILLISYILTFISDLVVIWGGDYKGIAQRKKNSFIKIISTEGVPDDLRVKYQRKLNNFERDTVILNVILTMLVAIRPIFFIGAFIVWSVNKIFEHK